MASRALIVGTAGHIDHGKSTLVRALTGIDPDRLKEEKERGITIDLGFAHTTLPSGEVASFVDVPGHERFVRHMLAGAHGIDAVLLVVAADESVMPQTREHFAICRLLGIRRGLVALTRCDVAEPDLQDLAEAEVRDLVRGSFLEEAPLLRVSARTGAGLDDLRRALDVLAAAPRGREDGALMRLPIDRVFTLHGFGTVVTGTLVSGALALGDEVEVLPAGRRARVRGLHVHGRSRDAVGAGNRAAVNLAGVEVADLARGDVICHPGRLRASSVLDVRLELLPGARQLADRARVRVHAASAEVLARVRLGAGRTLPGAEAADAQLRLEAPIVAVRGDRLVVRSYSPAETVGGARVLDSAPARRRPGTSPPLEAAEDAVLGALVGAAGRAGVESRALGARLGVAVEALRPKLLAAGIGLVAAEGGGEVALARAALAELSGAAEAALGRYHAEQPLRAAMPREELRARVFARAAAGAFGAVMEDLQRRGVVRVEGDGFARAGHSVTLGGDEAAVVEALRAKARSAGCEGLEPAGAGAGLGRDPRLVEKLLRVLIQEGALVRVGDRLVDAAAVAELATRVRSQVAPGGKVDVAVVKDLTGLSRKFVIPLLEALDRAKVTRRAGADRYLIG
ncbi:MAG: selenocysteine-specific translation elongation factor [Vicinamibacteria bacterium]|nr:selenocysteine-specific translation elongation factor [Vicinamibacteria bacterium]